MKQDPGGLNLYECVSDEYSLVVNCAGEMYLPLRFSTENRSGRADYYLLYLVQGHMDVLTDAGWQKLGPGTAVVFYPAKPYAYRNQSEETVRYYFVHFTGADAEKVVHLCGFPDAHPREIGVREKWIERIEAISREMLSGAELHMLGCCQMLMELFWEAGRAGAAPSAGELLRSREYIARNYAHPLTVEALAQMEHLSVSRYRARFRALAGKAPKDYLTETRLRKAMELLAGTNLSVGEIAELVGFGDQLYFSRIFKKKIGVSPSAYRRDK